MPTFARLFAPAAMLLAFAPAARAGILFRGDFSTGDLSQWSKVESRDPRSRLAVQPDPAGGGGRALRVLVRQGDEPIGASGNRNEVVWREDDVTGGAVDRTYAWSSFWRAGEPSFEAWQIFTQWHHFKGGGSPPLALLVRGDEVQLGTHTNEVLWSAPLERGRWHDFVMNVRWSSDPAVGRVELWYDGRIAVRRNLATLFPRQGVYLKQGLYRATRIDADQVVWHRGMRVGTTLDDVWNSAATGLSASGADTPAAVPEAASTAGPGGGGGGCASSGAPVAGIGALVLDRLRRRRRKGGPIG